MRLNKAKQKKKRYIGKDREKENRRILSKKAEEDKETFTDIEVIVGEENEAGREINNTGKEKVKKKMRKKQIERKKEG